ncbi:hypothetical protein [Streptomyces sp. S1]|uniref:hypothetical protein n=1 Tax=Streptomyces sp. S1 TaxID=718288 RepID=UPI001969AA74|nr:hypothetical protein [Streptomyces sp. S1]
MSAAQRSTGNAMVVLQLPGDGRIVPVRHQAASWRSAVPALLGLGISPADTELLTTGWSVVRTADTDVLRPCALRP